MISWKTEKAEKATPILFVIFVLRSCSFLFTLIMWTVSISVIMEFNGGYMRLIFLIKPFYLSYYSINWSQILNLPTKCRIFMVFNRWDFWSAKYWFHPTVRRLFVKRYLYFIVILSHCLSTNRWKINIALFTIVFIAVMVGKARTQYYTESNHLWTVCETFLSNSSFLCICYRCQVRSKNG